MDVNGPSDWRSEQHGLQCMFTHCRNAPTDNGICPAHLEKLSVATRNYLAWNAERNRQLTLANSRGTQRRRKDGLVEIGRLPRDPVPLVRWTYKALK